MLSRTSIAFRIYAGFALIGALAVVLALAAIFATDRARDNAQHFRALNERTFSVLELQAEVTELQRSVQLFATTGHESLADDASRRIGSIRRKFETVQAPASRPLVGRMRTSLDNYEQSLETMVTERRLRYQLVHVELPKLDQRLSELFRPPPGEDLDRWDQLEDAGRTLQRNLYRYLYEPDYQLLTDATEAVQHATEQLTTRDQQAFGDALDAYAKVFTRIVQATRGYLYLVGVVMAGEAWEFAHLTDQLRTQALSDIPAIVESMEVLAITIRTRTLLVGALALLGALGLSWWIARSISSPLRMITSTLDRLAKGEHIEQVPGADRADEIGVMAGAANAFKVANDRTATLLDEQRQLTDALESSRQALETSNREMEQFVYTVSHDLKTPLVTSMGFIGMMRELADDGETELALSKLEVLERSNRRMSELISGLLDLSRVGRLDTEREDVDPRRVIDEVLEQLASRIERADCTVEVAPELPWIKVNPTRLSQVLDNLITNALKYGRADEGPARVQIGCQPAPSGRAVLTIRDHGPGIPPEHHERVFGLFNRLSGGGEGTGIGLAIVQRVMQTSGGSVRLSSRGEGDGCTFELEFEEGVPDA